MLASLQRTASTRDLLGLTLVPIKRESKREKENELLAEPDMYQER